MLGRTGAAADTWTVHSDNFSPIKLTANSAAFVGECNQTSFIQERGGERLESKPQGLPVLSPRRPPSTPTEKEITETLPKSRTSLHVLIEKIVFHFRN